MSFVRKIGILPLAILIMAAFFIVFIRVQRTHLPPGAASAKRSSVLSYQAQTPANTVQDTAGACLTQAQYAQILGTTRQQNGLQLSGTATAQDGRRIEIYQTLKTGDFMIYATGPDRTGQYQACPLAAGKNLQLQPVAAAPATAIAITLPQTAPATAPH